MFPYSTHTREYADINMLIFMIAFLSALPMMQSNFKFDFQAIKYRAILIYLLNSKKNTKITLCSKYCS